MIKKVSLKRKFQKKDILRFATKEQRKEILSFAKLLQGKKVVHINATAQGGGVAELLKSFIPSLRAFGLDVDWYAIGPDADKKFFIITDKLRDALQGKSSVRLTVKEWELYEKVNRKIATDLDHIKCDVLVVHDWQVLFAGKFLRQKRYKIYVNHPDTSTPQKGIWQRMFPAMRQYDFLLFSNKDFVPKGWEGHKIKVIPPAIDPLSMKQTLVPQSKAKKELLHFGIFPQYPLIVQVSRFDRWKNPFGVIRAFFQVQKKHPSVQLALVGWQEAYDNPNAQKMYLEVAKEAGVNSNIFLFFSPVGVKDIPKFTMLFQNAADIVVQNSIKEGFGLTVAEAMWKRKAVVGGPADGIRRQIISGKNGFIANNEKELAKYILFLLSHPRERRKMGKAARESVRKHFLLPRLVRDHLKLYAGQ